MGEGHSLRAQHRGRQQRDCRDPSPRAAPQHALAQLSTQHKQHDEIDHLEGAQGLHAGNDVGGRTRAREEYRDEPCGRAYGNCHAGNGIEGAGQTAPCHRGTRVRHGAPGSDRENSQWRCEADEFIPMPHRGKPVGPRERGTHILGALGSGHALKASGEQQGGGAEDCRAADSHVAPGRAQADQQQGCRKGISRHKRVHRKSEQDACRPQDKTAPSSREAGSVIWLSLRHVQRAHQGQYHCGRGEAARGDIGIH